MEISNGFKKKFRITLYIIIFIAVEIVFGYFTLKSRNLFLSNSVNYGSYLAQAQTDKIETQLGEYVLSTKLAGTYLDEMLALNASDEQIHRGMVSFRNKIANEFGDNVIDIYAVLNGRIMAANPWEGDTSYDFSNTTWYKDAVATPGTPVFSNLYKDAVTGQNVFTISLALSDPHNVIALDVYLVTDNWMGFSELPNGYGLLIYDAQHTLAYSSGQVNEKILQESIAANSPTEVLRYAGAVQQNLNVYVCEVSNGWSVIIQIPSNDLIPPQHMSIMNLGLGFSILNTIIAIVVLTHNVRRSKYVRCDSLTGLLNKTFLTKCIRSHLQRTNGTLLVFDLDNFKKINDNYGHDCGDIVIVSVSNILQNCFRKTDCIGRFGGDEFVVYIDEVLSDEIIHAKLQEVIRQVSVLSEQYPLSNLSISIGGCNCQKGDKYSEVFKRADKALYEVKNTGKCGFAIKHT